MAERSGKGPDRLQSLCQQHLFYAFDHFFPETRLAEKKGWPVRERGEFNGMP